MSGTGRENAASTGVFTEVMQPRSESQSTHLILEDLSSQCLVLASNAAHGYRQLCDQTPVESDVILETKAESQCSSKRAQLLLLIIGQQSVISLKLRLG